VVQVEVLAQALTLMAGAVVEQVALELQQDLMFLHHLL
jgi:hypothetical protein